MKLLRILAYFVALLAISYVQVSRADVLISWSAVTSYTDATAIPANLLPQVGYAVYAKPCGSTQTPTRLNLPLLLSGLTYTNKQAVGCLTYTVTSNLAGFESVPTNPLNVTVPPAPAAPGNPTATAVVGADTHAYKRRETVGGYTWVVYGTVTAGTPCDPTHTDDGYRLIPRAAVTLTNRFDVHPLNEWAKGCQ